MTIKSIQGDEELAKFANATFYATLKTLLKEDHITQEQYDTICDNYVPVLLSKSGWRSWWDRVMNKDEEDIVAVVKTFAK